MYNHVSKSCVNHITNNTLKLQLSKKKKIKAGEKVKKSIKEKESRQ